MGYSRDAVLVFSRDRRDLFRLRFRCDSRRAFSQRVTAFVVSHSRRLLSPGFRVSNKFGTRAISDAVPDTDRLSRYQKLAVLSRDNRYYTMKYVYFTAIEGKIRKMSPFIKKTKIIAGGLPTFQVPKKKRQ